jgi:hypothetical protein
MRQHDCVLLMHSTAARHVMQGGKQTKQAESLLVQLTAMQPCPTMVKTYELLHKRCSHLLRDSL